MPWYLCYSPCKGRIRLSVHFLTTYYSLLANANSSLELRTPQSNCPALPVLRMGGVEDLREVDLVAVWGSRGAALCGSQCRQLVVRRKKEQLRWLWSSCCSGHSRNPHTSPSTCKAISYILLQLTRFLHYRTRRVWPLLGSLRPWRGHEQMVWRDGDAIAHEPTAARALMSPEHGHGPAM